MNDSHERFEKHIAEINKVYWGNVTPEQAAWNAWQESEHQALKRAVLVCERLTDSQGYSDGCIEAIRALMDDAQSGEAS